MLGGQTPPQAGFELLLASPPSPPSLPRPADTYPESPKIMYLNRTFLRCAMASPCVDTCSVCVLVCREARGMNAAVLLPLLLMMMRVLSANQGSEKTCPGPPVLPTRLGMLRNAGEQQDRPVCVCKGRG